MPERKYELMEQIVSMKYEGKKQYHIRFVGGERIVPKDEIVFIESFGRKLHFHLLHNEYILYQKLDDAESKFNDNDFLRIHQSYLVNMFFIECINSYRLYLKTGKVLSVPKVRYPDVKRQYEEWKRAAYDISG